MPLCRRGRGRARAIGCLGVGRREGEKWLEPIAVARARSRSPALANPLVAEAAMTPSLKNTLLSVVAGGIVLAAIGAAVVGVSTFDKIGRK